MLRSLSLKINGLTFSIGFNMLHGSPIYSQKQTLTKTSRLFRVVRLISLRECVAVGRIQDLGDPQKEQRNATGF